MKKSMSCWKTVGLFILMLTVVFSSVTVFGAPEKVKVNFWTLQSRGDLTKKLITDFMAANPNIEVVLTLNGTDDHKKNLKIAASSGTLPDAWFNWGGSLGSFYPENGLTVDLTAYAKKNNWNKRFMAPALDMCRFNGQLSGMPTLISAIGMYYNKQMFEKYKIKVPKTFAEFETALKTLKENGITPISTAGKDGWLVMRINEALIEYYAGAKLHDKLARLEASWDDPSVVKMYTKFKEWNDKGYFPQGFVTLDPNGDRMPLYSEQCAMVMQVVAFDNNVALDKMDTKKYGWFPFPTDQKPNRISGFTEMVQFSKKSPKAVHEATMKFVGFFYSDAMVDKYLNEFRHPLPVIGAKLPTTLPNIPAVVDHLNKNGSWLISDQALPQEVINKFFQTQDSVIIGSMTPNQAAKFMKDEIDKYKASKK